MSAPLNSGFRNNVNIVTIRTCGSSFQRDTDSAVDVDGNGQKEKVTITYVSGSAAGTPSAPGGIIVNSISGGSLYDPTGVARSVLSRSNEPDRGITPKTGTYTQGIS